MNIWKIQVQWHQIARDSIMGLVRTTTWEWRLWVTITNGWQHWKYHSELET